MTPLSKEPSYIVMQIKTGHGIYTVGILPEAPKSSYKYDIVALDLRTNNKKKQLVVMTPKEAVMFGVSLIRASILADIRILRNNPKDADWATNWEAVFQEPDNESSKP